MSALSFISLHLLARANSSGAAVLLRTVITVAAHGVLAARTLALQYTQAGW